VGAGQEGRWTVITVPNAGVEIAPEDLPHVFHGHPVRSLSLRSGPPPP